MTPRAPAPRPADAPPVEDAAYARLAGLRAGIRRYLAWGEQCAREHGLTAAQVQLALAVRAHEHPAGPTLRDLADALLLRHHSVVGLVDRAAQAGLVARVRDGERTGRVRVQLTADGAARLEALSTRHLRWLSAHGAELAAACDGFGAARR